MVVAALFTRLVQMNLVVHFPDGYSGICGANERWQSFSLCIADCPLSSELTVGPFSSGPVPTGVARPGGDGPCPSARLVTWEPYSDGVARFSSALLYEYLHTPVTHRPLPLVLNLGLDLVGTWFEF